MEKHWKNCSSLFVPVRPLFFPGKTWEKQGTNREKQGKTCFQCFSNVFPMFFLVFPMFFQCFSNVFPMFFCCFPDVFLMFFCCFSIVFLCCSHVFPCSSLFFPVRPCLSLFVPVSKCSTAPMSRSRSASTSPLRFVRACCCEDDGGISGVTSPCWSRPQAPLRGGVPEHKGAQRSFLGPVLYWWYRRGARGGRGGR